MTATEIRQRSWYLKEERKASIIDVIKNSIGYFSFLKHLRAVVDSILTLFAKNHQQFSTQLIPKSWKKPKKLGDFLGSCSVYDQDRV